MQKTLRSLIHEKIPLELRFQLELLSRKRNLINEEKHEKIIQLFRDFDIKDIVQLGPGTNRYAIKIDGYVLKIATDNDGKIDNLKEFKMAKRLYPYVTKTYEVSENGTLLVAEYISPFSSYHEMTMYAEQIREILTKISNTYLIGDVGITSKNYANWGIRTGSKDPVCLDFAYVYEVSSELFVCRRCNTGSMLIPDRDFKRLNCSNPTCGAEYSFEDIRARIGNDIHRHEIGDLTQEGYYLTSSNIITELSDQRSNYLVKKKNKNNDKKQKLEQKPEEDILMTKNVENNIAIAKMLTESDNFKFPLIKATAVLADDDNETGNLIKATAIVAEDSNDDEFEGNLAFSCYMDELEEYDDIETEIIQKPEENESDSDIIFATADSINDSESKVVESDNNEIINNDKSNNNSEINDWFIKNMKKAISNISNRIGNCLHINSQFDEVRVYIKDKIYPADYYKEVQNAVFNSLIRFCNFDIITAQNNRGGNGNYKIFNPPTKISGTEYEGTLIFMSRVWNNHNINRVEDPDMMDVYCKYYDDYVGIQREWLEIFKQRLAEKTKINSKGIDLIASAIAKDWCVSEDKNIEYSKEFEEYEKGLNIENESNDSEDYMSLEDVAESVVIGESNDEEFDNGLAFTGSMNVDIIQNPNEDDIDTEDDNVEEGEYKEFLSVEIYSEDDFDVIYVNTEDSFGSVNIPFYVRLDKVDINNYTPSIADDRNGVWDWLINFEPDLMFTTKDPDKWLEFNNVDPYINQPHAVIMDEDKGLYTIGIYYVKGIFNVIDGENLVPNFNEITLKKINKLLVDDIGYNRISHLNRSLKLKEFIYEEEYVINLLNNPENILEDDIENAAIEAIMEENSSVENYEEEFEEPKEMAIVEEDKEVKDESRENDVKEDIQEEEVRTVFKPIRRNGN